jgi:hypothetical protein
MNTKRMLLLVFMGSFLLSGVFGADVSLAWDPSASTGISGYKVYLGNNSRTYHSSTSLGNQTTHTVVNLGPGTWFFAVTAYDSSGNESDFSNEVSNIVQAIDTTPPSISGITSLSITYNSALISWITNEASNTQIDYGTSTGYGTTTTLISAMSTSHSQTLSGLAASTTYHYRVRSKDAAGNLAISGNYTFTTAAPLDTTAPIISGVKAASITSASAAISWTTNEASNTQIDYGTSTGYGTTTTLISAMSTSHSQTLSGLAASTTYHYRVRSKDAAGNLTISGDYTFTTAAPLDTTAPIISGVKASSITAASAAISWITNEASNTQIEYGASTGYGTTTTLISAMSTSHSQTLSGLTAGTTYHYRVRSRDAAGNLAISGDYAFTTASSFDINSGLAAAYAFDEGLGTASIDLSGMGNTATLYSTTWTSGKYGQALSFNGINSFASAGTGGFPEFNKPQTVACWVSVARKYSSTKSIVSIANSAFRSGSKLGLKDSQIVILKSNNAWITTATLPSLNDWHFIAYTFDGTISRLYVDGVLAGTSTIAPSSGTTTVLQIGRWINQSEYFNGKIDELRIYNRALNLIELQTVMNTPISPLGAAQSSPRTSEPIASILADATDITLASDSTTPIAAKPVIDLQLNQSSYLRGDTVQIKSLWISNPSQQSQLVEAKTWIALPGMQPVSLAVPNVADSISLSPGFNQDYGTTPILNISRISPLGSSLVGARLLNPVTGEVVSEDLNALSIYAYNQSSLPNQLLPAPLPRVILQRSYSQSGIMYTVVNSDKMAADVEIKVWLDNADGTATSLFVAGADGTITLSAKDRITLYPQSFSPNLRVRVLEAATGTILCER